MQSVVDAHVHIFKTGALPARWFEIGAERWAGSKWPTPSTDAIDIEGGLTDDEAALVIPDMDAAGISAAVCHTLDWAWSLGEPEIAVPAIHRWYSELQNRFSGRVYATAGVDPRRPDAVEILDDALGTLGLKGLKLYPPTGFHVSDQICFPLYEKCLEYDVPVVVHTAFVGYPHIGHFANPLYIGEVQTRYPDLRIVLAHSGYPFWSEEAIEIVAHHPNSYLELSNWNLRHHTDADGVMRTLLQMRGAVGAHRMLFASDHLGGRRFSGARSQVGSWANFVRSLFAAPDGSSAGVINDDASLIMGENAKRVFGLNTDADNDGE